MCEFEPSFYNSKVDVYSLGVVTTMLMLTLDPSYPDLVLESTEKVKERQEDYQLKIKLQQLDFLQDLGETAEEKSVCDMIQNMLLVEADNRHPVNNWIPLLEAI